MADVVVAAGVDAARDVQLDLADVVLEVEVVEALGDGGRDRDRFRIRQRAVVAARAGNDVGQQADVRRGQALGLDLFPDLEQFRLLDVGQHQVLLVGHAQLAEAVLVGHVGDDIHLLGGAVARRHAGLFQRQHDRGVARHLVRLDVALQPVGEGLVVLMAAARVDARQRQVRLRIEVGGDAVEFLLRQGFRTVLQVGEFRFDQAREFLGADGLDQDLDAGLVLVVAAAELVVHAHHGFGVGQQVLPTHELVDHAAQDRRTAEAAAHHELEADLASLVAHRGQADVVHGDRGAVFDGAVEGDLELARQGDELGVEGAPLANDLGKRARIDDLVRRHAGELVGRGIADAVARGLDRVHFHRSQVGQDVRGLFQVDPVELDVLAGREVTIAAVVLARDVGEHAHLRSRQQAVRHGDAQHVGMALHVQAVLQAQRQEFFFGQLIGEAAAYLVAVLGDALAYDEMVVLVVTVHVRILVAGHR